ncbi:MAG TPA: beta-L-arabinofuranosidase domain-containing protein [Puia sp.]|nr:beta-L-arabinofuranosidase domain-containing protein [Puia sp.]
MYQFSKTAATGLLGMAFSLGAIAQDGFRRFEAVGFESVQINDAFWKPRIDKVATVTLRACIDYTELKTPRIRNFEIAGGTRKGVFEGIFYDDSDVYKALEAISYAIRDRPDSALEKKADEWIDKIAAAQLPDGYINTYFTLTGLDKRWTDMSMHEDYNGGHLIEAAVAYYHATGKRKLLDVAIRFANHFDTQFGPGKRHWVTGHEELELALVKLYRTTNDSRYLRLAAWLLEERGHGYAHGYTWTDWKDTAYAQDKTPVRDTKKITGHAVRAMYLYTGTADVASLTHDSGYLRAMEAVWEDVVHRNMYLTGGIGSSGNNEGFSTDFDLPNEQAYCETCASVGMVLWNQRMNQLTGDAKYADILERSLYNAALDGLSFSGDRFFYGNPLASPGRYKRSEWFGTACCPANIARLVASLGNYIYGQSDHGIWINLFIGSQVNIATPKGNFAIRQETNYPWDGKINISISPDKKTTLALYIRIPGWARGEAVPGNLYYFINRQPAAFSIKVNGHDYPYRMEQGYAVIEREWKKTDLVSVDLPMEVQMVRAADSVKADADRVALQRGPLVYCVEGADNGGRAWNILMPVNTVCTTKQEPGLLGGLVTIEATVPAVQVAPDGMSVSTSQQAITAIPYFSWCNRGSGPMQVWLPVKIKDLKLNF